MIQKFKQILLLLFFLLCFQQFTQAMGIIEAFYKFPVEILYQLHGSAKTEALKKYFLNEQAIVNSRYNTPIILTKVDTIGNYLKIKTSNVGYIELKTITTNKGKTLIFHNSVTCGTACDSHITIYDENWYFVPIQSVAPALLDIKLSSFFTLNEISHHTYDINKIIAEIQPIFYQLNFLPNTNDLLISLDLSNLPDNSRKILQPHFQPTILIKWNGEKFE